MRGAFGRLYRGETTVDFFGRRKWGFLFSGALLVITLGSVLLQGLNLGIDFKGGVAWEVPVTSTFDIEAGKEVLSAEGVEERSAKFQVLTSSGEQRVRIQAGALEPAKVTEVQQALADRAKVDLEDVSQATVSSTWGRSITNKAVRALLVFMLFVSAFISWRFEWRMAVSAIAAMVHDVGVSVGVYSVLSLEVTPATVVAFLTILGFSLYDTIVVFDKVHENTQRFSGSRVSYGDIVNVSMNQVLMRSLNTSVAAVLPVISLLVLGSGVFGAVALQEFALALIVGLATGAYSSIFIAAPLLGILKNRETAYAPQRNSLSLGAEMAHLMATGAPAGRRGAVVSRVADLESEPAAALVTAEAVLSHPPRPRKKGRR
ncbi:MAG: protein translocase subunit SecF [Ilumatobacteraceae bacterium]